MAELERPKTRIQYYDNLRAFACFLVILTHSAMPALDPSYGAFMVFFSLLASPSSELFVSISSSLLAPTKLSLMEFYKKRFTKLIWPFLFWSVFMVTFRFCMGQIDGSTAIKRIVLFPIKPVEGVYWFVYAICALYLLNPIISPWLAIVKKKELQFVLALWIVTLILPYLNIITGRTVYNINGNYNFILIYMGGFVGYMLLGVYFKKFPVFIPNKWMAIMLVIVLVILGTIPILWSYIFYRDATALLTNNLSLSSALYVSAIYIYFKNFKFHHFMEYWMTKIAKYSFGIYLIHILIVRQVVWKVLENHRISHPLLETPVIAITSLFICLGIIKCLSYLPKSKYIIGA